MAGMCSSRLVLPPKAACTTMALCSAASREDVAAGRAAAFQRRPAPAPSARPCPARSAGRKGRGRSAGSAQAQRFGDDLAGGGRAEKLAAAAGRGAGPAAQLGRLFQRDLAVGKARADGLHLAGVFALGRRQRHAAGHEDARAGRAGRPGPSSWRAAPCRRWPRPSRRARVGSERISRRSTMAASLR